MISRKYQQYIKVVVLTSLVWCLLDVWLLTYFSNCTDSPTKPEATVKQRGHNEPVKGHHGVVPDSNENREEGKKEDVDRKGLLDRLIDKVPQGTYIYWAIHLDFYSLIQFRPKSSVRLIFRIFYRAIVTAFLL